MKTLTHLATASALALLATDGAVAGAETPTAPVAANPGLLTFELPNLPGEHSFDVSNIPAEERLELLKNATRTYIANRVNSAHQRHQKDPLVVSWNAYDEAVKADALQTAVPMPTAERPAAPDLAAVLQRAYDDLKAGNIRRQTGESKPRARKDPLIGLVTKAVIKDVFESRKAADKTFTYVKAAAEVGGDGVAYLNAMIEKKVAEGVDRTALEKMRDTKYINPAKIMLGINDTKAMKELPSLL